MSKNLMNNINLYRSSNGVQKCDSKYFIRLYQSDIELQCNKFDSELLDVGCGDGYVTVEILGKYVPETLKIHGVDISEGMITFAKSMYRLKNVQFSVLNIESINIPEKLKNRFDMVTSFNCLHWVEDQRTCLGNIYDMMKEGGSCLMVYPIQHAVMDAYKVLMKNPTWANVMADAMRYIPTMAKFPDPAAECCRILEEKKFQDMHVECKKRVFTYNGINELTDFFTAVNPFIKNIKKNKVKHYVNDLLSEVLLSPSVVVTYDQSGEINTIETNYKMLVIHAKK